MTLNINDSTFKRYEDIAESLINWQQNKRSKHFSFIIHKKRIISIGQNKSKTHPTNLRNRKISVRTGEDFSEQKHICSEFDAINKLKKQTNIDTEKCTLVNLRYDRNRRLAYAKPCMSCKSLLTYFHFKNIVFSTNEGKYESYNTNDI